jgi:hypothetical protein
MKSNTYTCKYCGTKMKKFDFELNNGYCGKCRSIKEWKEVLGDLKDLER